MTRQETKEVGINTKKVEDFGNGQLLYNFNTEEERDVYTHNICHYAGIHTDGHCWYRISRMSDTYARMFHDAVKILKNQDEEIENPEEYEYTVVFRTSNPEHIPFDETIKFNVSLLKIISRDDLEDSNDDVDDDDDENNDEDDENCSGNMIRSQQKSNQKTFMVEFATFENMYRYCRAIGLKKTNVYRCQNKFCIEIPSGKKKDRTDNFDRYGMCALEYDGEIDDMVRKAFVLEHGELASTGWEPFAS